MSRKTIYFVCTGNACRSQMAEGFGRAILGAHWNVYSAGIEAHSVNPQAVKAMAEAGIDISHHTSDIIHPELMTKADLVVTLCSDADQNCPLLPEHVKKEHWGFDDPAGKDWATFQRVRDEIKMAIEQFKTTREDVF
ncbi:arsenate reductase (thioredoxin) [Staphylococcus canis]|uniref:Arsenate reductase n=1 Tax=Staphylococcus canis TaxID=2724942 RepID=A0ABS0TA05_9STAP|nr:arsenate reductase (thioredoxin) [Staphylococcus canis]MBI5975578.1 arsenate reductase (thioredoxin) [Staphylococcus canis]